MGNYDLVNVRNLNFMVGWEAKLGLLSMRATSKPNCSAWVKNMKRSNQNHPYKNGLVLRQFNTININQ